MIYLACKVETQDESQMNASYKLRYKRLNIEPSESKWKQAPVYRAGNKVLDTTSQKSRHGQRELLAVTSNCLYQWQRVSSHEILNKANQRSSLNDIDVSTPNVGNACLNVGAP